HRARDLADALEAAQPPRLRSELLHEPVGRDDVDPVDEAQPGARGEDGTSRIPVDLARFKAGVGDGGQHGLHRESAERDVGAARERARGGAHDGAPSAGAESGRHDAVTSKTGTDTPSATSLNDTVTGAPTASASGASPRSRPMTRTSASSSSISATAYGTSGANPGRNAWRITVHVLTRPRPLTGSKRNRRP